jgi:DNA transformation protein and related proteins
MGARSEVGALKKTTKTKRPSEAGLPSPRMASLRVSAGFRDFVLDQLVGISDLRAKSMFGGVGLYSGEHFFGILAADVLYLKADDTTRDEFVKAGGRPFMPYPGRAMSMGYYSVPIDVLENAPDVVQWATRAIRTAHAATGRRPARTRRRSG